VHRQSGLCVHLHDMALPSRLPADLAVPRHVPGRRALRRVLRLQHADPDRLLLPGQLHPPRVLLPVRIHRPLSPVIPASSTASGRSAGSTCRRGPSWQCRWRTGCRRPYRRSGAPFPEASPVVQPPPDDPVAVPSTPLAAGKQASSHFKNASQALLAAVHAFSPVCLHALRQASVALSPHAFWQSSACFTIAAPVGLAAAQQSRHGLSTGRSSVPVPLPGGPPGDGGSG
jgi:hypothetical protein